MKQSTQWLFLQPFLARGQSNWPLVNIFLVFLLCIFLPRLNANVSLPAVFANNMVLQRGTQVAIFGTAANGENVTVTFNGQTKTTTSNGSWKVYLDAMSHGGPYTLTVQGNNTVAFSGVMVGDVWLCSGQSNMANRISDEGYTSEVSSDNYPNIRIKHNLDAWRSMTTSNIQYVSALGYFFAREAHLASGVPIGIIVGAQPASGIEQWMDPTSLAQNADAASYTSNGTPGGHFNNYIAPVVGYTISGCLWNQGENNGSNGEVTYSRWIRSMIPNWRNRWGYDFPFVITQLPKEAGTWRPAQTAVVNPYAIEAPIRQGQFDALSLTKTVLVTTWDISDGDIHPHNKREVAARAVLAYKKFCLNQSLEFMGPICQSTTISGNKLILNFIHTGGGLQYTNGLGMGIAGSNNQWYPANVQVSGNTLTLSSPNVASPTQARYMWEDNIQPAFTGNLTNGTGIASPTFRTDAQFRPLCEGCDGSVISVTGVSINESSPSVNVGATRQLTCTVVPANATNKAVTWSSVNPSIATVDNTGLVSGVAEGTTNITVSTQDGNKTATVMVTVTDGGACTWVFGANEWETVSFSGTKQVRFGANGSYFYKTATSSIGCNATAFGGDPAPGLLKKCGICDNAPVYVLSVSAVNGTITKNPNQDSYAPGTSVTLTATANAGYTFTGWSGDTSGTTNPIIIPMNRNKNITANFSQDILPTCLLTNPSFEANLAGWTINSGTIATSTDALEGTKSARLTGEAGMEQGYTTSQAVGKPITLSFSAKISGTVGWAGVGIDFKRADGTDIQKPLLQITNTSWQTKTISLVAPVGTAKLNVWAYTSSGYLFVDNFCISGVIPDEYTLTTNATNGIVVKNPNKTTYAKGEQVTLTATANAGYTFTGWSGDTSGTTNPIVIPMNRNKNITANFSPVVTYTLTTNATNGTIVRSPNKTSYSVGEQVSLTATANEGYTFTGWSGDTSGTTNPIIIPMNRNKNITANFSQDIIPTCLLTNPSFEANLAGWTINSGTIATSTDAVEGTKSARLTGEAGMEQGYTTNQAVGKLITLTFSAKISGTVGWAGVGIDFKRADGTDIQKPLLQITNTGWQTKTISLTAPEGTAKLNVWAYTSSGYLFVDNCCISGIIPDTIVDPTSITISPASLNLCKDGTSQLQPDVLPENASNKVVVWSTSNPAVATVNGSGLVTAIGAGTATITATVSGTSLTASSTVTVANCIYPPLPLIGAAEIAWYGKNIQNFMGKISNGQPVKITFYGQSLCNIDMKWTEWIVDYLRQTYPQTTITSENRAVPGCSSDCLAPRVASDLAGCTADLIIFHDYANSVASYNTVIANIKNAVPNAEILIWGDHVNVTDASAHTWHDQMSFTNYPATANTYGLGYLMIRQIWKDYLSAHYGNPYDANVARVLMRDDVHFNDHGSWVLTEIMKKTFVLNSECNWAFAANEGGTVTVASPKNVRYGANGSYFYQTVTSSIGCNNTAFGGDPIPGVVKKCEVCDGPVDPTRVTGVTLNYSSLSLTVGGERQLLPNITPASATNKNVIWLSSSSVVSVTNSGYITANAIGSATITVTTEDGGFTATCIVNVVGEPIGLQIGTNFWSAEHSIDANGAVSAGNNGYGFAIWKAGTRFADYPTDPWNPQFMDEISIYSTIRFMDWNNINWGINQYWNERTQVYHQRQSSDPGIQWAPQDWKQQDGKRTYGVAYEWMIDLCNRKNANMWINIPYMAMAVADFPHGDDFNNDYIHKLAILLHHGVDMKTVNLKTLTGNNLADLQNMTRQQLINAGGVATSSGVNSNLKIFIELSNEPWLRENHNYASNEGVKLDPSTGPAPGYYAQYEWVAWGLPRMWKAFADVFGRDNPQVVRILCGVFWYDNHVERVMNIMNSKYNPWNLQPSYYSWATYVGGAGTTNQLGQFRTNLAAESAKWQAARDFVKSRWNLGMISYEGGQHFDMGNGQIAFAQNPDSYTAYIEWLREVEKSFDIVCHYTHSGHVTAWDQAWGAMMYQGQPLAEAHRYRALKHWVDGTAKNVEFDNVEISASDNSSDAFRIYPNPVKEGQYYTIELPEASDAVVSMYTVSNQLVLNQRIHQSKSASIAVNGLKPGIYVVFVTTASNNYLVKLIVE